MKNLPYYEVIVGNIGTVYNGRDEKEARKDFATYMQQSIDNYGRAGRESVVLMKDGEIIEEYEPPNAMDRAANLDSQEAHRLLVAIVEAVNDRGVDAAFEILRDRGLIDAR